MEFQVISPAELIERLGTTKGLLAAKRKNQMGIVRGQKYKKKFMQLQPSSIIKMQS
jgi:hypothetical protein